MRAKLRFSGQVARFTQRLAGQREGELRLNSKVSGVSSREERASSKPHLPPAPSRERQPFTKAFPSCPNCDSTNLKAARPKGWTDNLKNRMGLGPLLCLDCRHEFRLTLWRWDVIRYARCPRCANLNLADWHEKYYLPPRYKRALILLGANAHRCEACRLNFVSFRPRWRRRESTA